MMAGEEEEFVLGKRSDLEDRTVFDLLPLSWVGRIDEIGVASCDGAELGGVGAGPDSGGHGWIGEAEGEGGEEGFGGRVSRADEEFEGSAFDLFDLSWVDEMAGRGDEWAAFEDGDLPVVGEARIDFDVLKGHSDEAYLYSVGHLGRRPHWSR